MRRLQIGMWDASSLVDWEAYGGGLINGIEISQYQMEQEVANVQAFCRSQGIAYGIHAPMLVGGAYPQVTSPDRSEQQVALAAMQEEVQAAAVYGADYLLFHYPYPPIFPAVKCEGFNLGGFLYHESEQIQPDVFREASVRLFDHVSELQVQTKQKIVLEYDFFGDVEPIFNEMFALYPDVQLVVDVQRVEVHKRMFPGFDPYPWLAAVAPFAYLVHYSNTRYEQGNWQRHLPVLPHHEHDPAYGDAIQYLRFLAQRNDRFHVTFEHNPKRVSREELDECYRLAAEILHETEQVVR